MKYYILYPRNMSKPVKIVTARPDAKKESKAGYGFAEGSFKTQKDVCRRLNAMGIPFSRRPIKYRKYLGGYSYGIKKRK